MKGLLLKDLYTVYSYKKQYTLIVGFMLIWAIFMKNVAFISIYMLILGGMLVLSSMSTDEAVHFNRLALTMPISPATLVKSKYILLIITMGGGTILACIINAICLQFLNKWMSGFDWQGILLTALVFIITYSITLPLIFKMGVEKARYVYIGVMLGLALLILGTASLLEKLGISIGEIEDVNGGYLIIGLLGISVLVLVISYLCSLKVVKKKEW